MIDLYETGIMLGLSTDKEDISLKLKIRSWNSSELCSNEEQRYHYAWYKHQRGATITVN